MTATATNDRIKSAAILRDRKAEKLASENATLREMLAKMSEENRMLHARIEIERQFTRRLWRA